MIWVVACEGERHLLIGPGHFEFRHGFTARSLRLIAEFRRFHSQALKMRLQFREQRQAFAGIGAGKAEGIPPGLG